MLDSYFQVDEQPIESEGHHSNLPKNDFRVKYFEALDLITGSICSRFDQASFIAFSNLESYLIQLVKGQIIVDSKIVKYIREMMLIQYKVFCWYIQKNEGNCNCWEIINPKCSCSLKLVNN